MRAPEARKFAKSEGVPPKGRSLLTSQVHLRDAQVHARKCTCSLKVFAKCASEVVALKHVLQHALRTTLDKCAHLMGTQVVLKDLHLSSAGGAPKPHSGLAYTEVKKVTSQTNFD